MHGYETLIAGLLIFIGIHLVSFTYELRTKLITLVGVTWHRVGHSLLSLLGLYLIATGFASRPMEEGLQVPEWGLMAPIVGMPFVFILFSGFIFKGDFLRITRHPMLLAVALFALLHLLANGDKGSVMLFASFMVWALLSMPLCEAKFLKTQPESAKKTFSSTSVIPFLALIQMRAAPPKGDRAVIKAIGLGVVLYFAVAFAHPYFTGISVVS